MNLKMKKNQCFKKQKNNKRKITSEKTFVIFQFYGGVYDKTYQTKGFSRNKKIDLLTYLGNYQPDRLKKISHDTYCIKDHESLHISNGLWHWQSMGIGGRSALDFLMKVDNYSFLDCS